MSQDYLSGESFLEKTTFRLHHLFPKQVLVGLLGFIILTNLVYLDLVFWGTKTNNEKTIITTIPSVTPIISPAQIQQDNPAVVPATVSAQTTVITAKNPPAPIMSTPQEYFIPFGAGATSASDWEDVVGLQATVDSTLYKKIKSAVLEVSLSIPTGNETAYVRLFNKTDKHPVWFSDVFASGGTTQFIVSSQITLDSGSKTYQLQAKTSLSYPANINQARIHIITY